MKNQLLCLFAIGAGAIVSTALPANAGIVISDNYGNCLNYCEMIHVNPALQEKYQNIDMKWYAYQWIKENPTNIMVVAHNEGRISYPRLFAHAYQEAAKLFEISNAE